MKVTARFAGQPTSGCRRLPWDSRPGPPILAPPTRSSTSDPNSRRLPIITLQSTSPNCDIRRHPVKSSKTGHYLISRPGYRRDAGAEAANVQDWRRHDMVVRTNCATGRCTIAVGPPPAPSPPSCLSLACLAAAAGKKSVATEPKAKKQERAASAGGQEAADGHHRRGT
jgi:hypothetical protein